MKRRRSLPAATLLRIEQLESRQMLSLQSALATMLTDLGEASDWPVRPPTESCVPRAPSLDALLCGSAEPRVSIDAPFRIGIYGDGFFIVEGPDIEFLYTRTQDYQLNDEYQLVTSDSMRLLGYGVGSEFQLDRSELVPLTVPLGMVASSVTTRATFVGNLSPQDSRLGETTFSEFIVYDELGMPQRITLRFELTSTLGGTTTYQWQASIADNRDRAVGINAALSSGEIEFDHSGKVVFGGTHRIAFKNTIAAATPWEIQLHFDQLTALASQLGRYGPIVLSAQDGYPVGTLRDYSITERGEIKGLFDTGMSRTLGQIQLASFPNPHGLMERASGYYAGTSLAGVRANNDPGANHFGSVVHFPAGVDLNISGPAASPSYPWDLRTLRLAANGNGFFILEDSSGRQFYTRNGEFYVNAQEQLISQQGLKLLGYDANTNFELNAARLSPIDVPIGMTAASATQNAAIFGNLSPRAEPATIPGILVSERLGDGSIPSPDDSSIASIHFTLLMNASSTWLNVGGNYAYRLTFFNTETGFESRPTQALGWLPIIDVDRQIHIDNLPSPGGVRFNAVRIYRNTEDSPDSYDLLTTLTNGETTYLDDNSDAAIENNSSLNLVGPGVIAQTRLIDVVRWNGTTYEKPFVEGTLSFRGERGGLPLALRHLQIRQTTTVADLLRFLTEAFGIDGSVRGPTGELPGGTIVDGRLRLVSNAGEANSLEIPISALELLPTNSSIAHRVQLPFQILQQPDGHGTQTGFVVFDSTGAAVVIRLATVLDAKGDWGATYRWFAYLADGSPLELGQTAALGNGTITFGPSGNVIAGQNAEITMNRAPLAAPSSLTFSLDFSRVTGLFLGESGWYVGVLQLIQQDGYPPGALERFRVDQSGLITGVFDNGLAPPLGQIVLADFRNPAQLRYVGNGLYIDTAASGRPRIGQPGDGAFGTVRDQRPDAAADERPTYRPPSRHFQTSNWRAARRVHFARQPMVPAFRMSFAPSVIDAAWASTDGAAEKLCAVFPEASTKAVGNSNAGLSTTLFDQ